MSQHTLDATRACEGKWVPLKARGKRLIKTRQESFPLSTPRKKKKKHTNTFLHTGFGASMFRLSEGMSLQLN